MSAKTSSDWPAEFLDRVGALLDREAVRDTVYRYGSVIDAFDRVGVRSVLSDDIVAQYGNDKPIIGGDAVAAWINSHDVEVVLQHHFLNVYGVEVEGDLAQAQVYHTSHQWTRANTDLAKIIVGRYQMELIRSEPTWKIARLEMEVLWADERPASEQFMEAIGGRGPAHVQPRLSASSHPPTTVPRRAVSQPGRAGHS